MNKVFVNSFGGGRVRLLTRAFAGPILALWGRGGVSLARTSPSGHKARPCFSACPIPTCLSQKVLLRSAGMLFKEM